MAFPMIGPNTNMVLAEGRVKLDLWIGRGSFGEVYSGKMLKTGKDVAVKLESIHAPSNKLKLLSEARNYELLEGSPGVPHLYWYGTEGDLNIMVIDLLGPSLERVFQTSGRVFDLKTTLALGIQMIDCIEGVHNCGLIHRDVKPANILMGGASDPYLLHLVDFGLAKRYIEKRSEQHIRLRTKKAFTGTATFASARTHLGLEQSRRDDLEAVGFILVYFLRGRLPWQDLQTDTGSTREEKITEMKSRLSPHDLCEGLPEELTVFLEYCKALGFQDKPDYNLLRCLLRGRLINEISRDCFNLSAKLTGQLNVDFLALGQARQRRRNRNRKHRGRRKQCGGFEVLQGR
eukprot:gb/GFBE01049691.1/.p1 GENE.gb/GFBE01049691.1/~~gb/GFBE01049691.1/.p1  ORF type:complete len:346 (+),score=33.33 gb/GFBE01049691.1/:1-1038(+)